MKNILTVLALTCIAVCAEASDCGTMSNAEEAIVKQFNIDSSDAWVQALYSADENMAGGKIIYRKIVVRINSAHSAAYRDFVTTYTILNSYDGPDNGNYCSLSGIEHKTDVCNARPDLQICQTATAP